MKKVLLATSAITAISLAGIASAQESQMMSAGGNTLSIGGYYEFGYASRSDDIDNKDGKDSKTYGDSELYIDFETTSDSGLTYGVQIDMEIVNGSNYGEDGKDSGKAANAEEASIYVSGDFGTMHFGHDDNAYGRFLTWAPTHEGATSQDDNILWVNRLPNSAGPDNISGNDDDVANSLDLAYTTVGANPYEDNAKVAYVSPNFSGFQFGASYADSDSTKDNPTALGASYGMDIGGMNSGMSFTLTAASYNNNADGTGKSTDSQYGISFGLNDLTVTAARYSGKTGNINKKATEFGIGYQITDSLSVGASMNNAESDGTKGGSKIDQEGDYQSFSGSYKIAPGLKTTLAFNNTEVSDNRKKISNDGSELVWQLEFAF